MKINKSWNKKISATVFISLCLFSASFLFTLAVEDELDLINSTANHQKVNVLNTAVSQPSLWSTDKFSSERTLASEKSNYS